MLRHPQKRKILYFWDFFKCEDNEVEKIFEKNFQIYFEDKWFDIECNEKEGEVKYVRKYH